MKKIMSLLATFSLVAGTLGAASAVSANPAPAPSAAAAPKWIEGRNYFPIRPARPTGLPAGKVQVTEVFSYACPACNQFQPSMRKLEHSVPGNVVINFLPASFNSAEDWPMFQLAYVTAQTLGIADKAHDAMFDAVWTTGELGTTDRSRMSRVFTRNIRASQPPNSWPHRSRSASTIRSAWTRRPSSNSAWIAPRPSW
jgi:hypothetical protein